MYFRCFELTKLLLYKYYSFLSIFKIYHFFLHLTFIVYLFFFRPVSACCNHFLCIVGSFRYAFMVTQMEKRLSRSTLIDSYTVCRSFLLFHCLPPYWPGNDEIILRVSATPPQRIENRRRKIFFLREIGWLSGSPRWFSMAKGSHFFGGILLHFFLSFSR